MSRLILIALKDVFKNKKTLFITSIQLFFSLLLTISTISLASQVIDTQLLFNNQKLNQFSLYCPYFSLGGIPTNMTYKDKESHLKRISPNAEWGILGKVYLADYETKDSLSECYFMNDTIVDNVSLPLQKGKWFNSKDNEATAIVSTDLAEKLQLGQQYTIRLTDTDKSEQITVRIIGVLNKDNEMLNLSGNKAGDIFSKNFSGIAVYSPNQINSNLNLTFANFLVKNPSSNIGSDVCFTIKDIIKQYNEENKLLIGIISIFAIMSISLSFSGIGASTFLKSRNEIKKYTLYYFCGAKWSSCVLIELIKTLFTLVLTILPVVIMYFIFYNNIEKFCSIKALLIGICVDLIIYLPSALWKMIQIVKQSPVDVIKNY